jgi:Cupin
MMAPHVNPRAIEYGFVLDGTGRILVVFPDGTTAMDAKVSADDVFWIPRYFPFCQVASLSGPFEFFGFTTLARRNYPQFLLGRCSILKTMLGPELAAGFGVSESKLRDLVDAQREEVILPSWPEPERKKEKKRRRGTMEEERGD